MKAKTCQIAVKPGTSFVVPLSSSKSRRDNDLYPFRVPRFTSHLVFFDNERNLRARALQRNV